MFTCINCEKQFTKKSNYLQHVNRKTSCVKNDWKCPVCNKVFDRKYHLVQHMNKKTRCTKYDDSNSTDVDALRLKLENEKLKRELAEEKMRHMTTALVQSQAQAQSVNNGTVVNGDATIVQGDVNVQVNIRNFGEENIDHIKNNRRLIREILDSRINGARRMLIEVYYNSKVPENKNMKLLDESRCKMGVMVGNEWKARNAREHASKVYGRVTDILHGCVVNMAEDGETFTDREIDTLNGPMFQSRGAEEVDEFFNSMMQLSRDDKTLK